MNNTTCKHFTGIQNTCCKIGIEYKSVTPNPERLDGSALRIPCMDIKTTSKIGLSPSQLEHYNNRGTCSKFELPTQEELDKEEAEFEERFKEVMHCLANNLPLPEGVYVCGHKDIDYFGDE